MNQPNWLRPVVRGAWRLGVLAGLLAALSACVEPRVVLLQHPGGTRISMLPEQPAAPDGIAPEFAQITPLKIESILRRSTITHSTWISFVHSEPKPLFSPEQIRLLRAPLADALARLGPRERLLVELKDQYKGRDVEMVVYPDGAELVFRFLALIKDREDVTTGDDAIDQGELVAQPGQTVSKPALVSTLRQSIRQSDFARTERVARMRERIEKGYQEKIVDSGERARLLQLAALEEIPGEEVLRLFWERWELLYKAHREDLIDDAAYAERKSSLMQELGR